MSPLERDPLPMTDEELRRRMKAITRRSLLTGGAAASVAALGYRMLDHSATVGMLRRPLRAAEDFNALLAQKILGQKRLAPTFAEERALKNPRPNGPFGMVRNLDLNAWRLQVTGMANAASYAGYMADVTGFRYAEVVMAEIAEEQESHDAKTEELAGGSMSEGPAAGSSNGEPPLLQPQRPLPAAPGVLVAMEELKKLPFVRQTVEFKCIEGWSEIIEFGGVRFSDFMAAYPPAGGTPAYVAMESPGGAYFSGYEMEAMQHPQTLLCTEMAGRPLTRAHGAPLRLVMPLKYGYKQIKQIARISYTNTRPADFWAELGYDWHGGL